MGSGQSKANSPLFIRTIDFFSHEKRGVEAKEDILAVFYPLVGISFKRIFI